MTLRVQIAIAVIVIIGLIYVINLVRKRRLELKYSLAWIIAAIIILILDCFPKLMVGLTDLLGLALPVNMMMFFGIGFTLMIALTLTVAISINAASVKRLTQKIALLEKEIEEIKKIKEYGKSDE